MRRTANWTITAINRLNRRIGRATAWLTLGMVIAQFGVVLLRYIFGLGFAAVQESVIWMHATVFMLAAGFTLADDGHVRVDIFYREASARTKAIIDGAGVLLFLWPVSGLIFAKAWPYVANSWAVLESSPEASGLPGLYLLKSLILVMPALLGLQGLAMLLRAWLTLTGREAP